MFLIFLFKQKTAYEMRISDWSSDVCSSDLRYPRQCRCSFGIFEKTICRTQIDERQGVKRIRHDYADHREIRAGANVDLLKKSRHLLDQNSVLRLQPHPELHAGATECKTAWKCGKEQRRAEHGRGAGRERMCKNG